MSGDLDLLDQRSRRLLTAARERFALGEMLGRGGYAAVFALDGHPGRALKFPSVARDPADAHPDVVAPGYGPLRVDQVGETGPFVLSAPRTFDEAAQLVRECAAVQLGARLGRPLARAFALHELADGPALEMERVDGTSLRTLLSERRAEALAVLGALARTLPHLHLRGGAHGDLKPEHVVSAEGKVILIDPLFTMAAEEAAWCGSIGYALPGVAGALRDLGALAAMAVEAHGRTLGWNGRMAYAMVNRFNGRFATRISLDGVKAAMRNGTDGMPEPLREWALHAAGACAETAFLGRAASVGDPEGWTREMLERFPAVA